MFRSMMVPVSTVTLRQKCVGGANMFCPGWFLMAEVHMTAPGRWSSTGTRVTYEVDGHTYYEDLHRRFGATTGRDPIRLPPSCWAAPRPDPCEGPLPDI
jgi:hypothetical protein